MERRNEYDDSKESYISAALARRRAEVAIPRDHDMHLENHGRTRQGLEEGSA